MRRTFRYPLHVNAAQDALLCDWLWKTRTLYNAALEERKSAYDREHKSITLYDQMKSLTQIRADDAALDNVPLRVSRGPLRRLDLAFKAFFRRVKSGAGAVGYPRFRGRDGWDSLDFADGFSIDGDRVMLRRGMTLRFWQYRPMKGEPKACRIKREGGKWFVCFACELPDVPKVAVKSAVGIDLGLTTFATLSNGEEVENPRFGKEAAERIAETQRELARKKRGSNNRAKVKARLGTIYRRVRNRRLDFARKLAVALFARFDLVAYEELDVKGLIEKRDGMNLSRSISDAAWRVAIGAITSKAESAGKWAVPVDPRGSTQQCSGCGKVVPKGLRDRVHSCPTCGLVLGRDWNAAINVKQRGMRCVAERGDGMGMMVAESCP